jgi:flagellar biosynthesis GTPase FlhF
MKLGKCANIEHRKDLTLSEAKEKRSEANKARKKFNSTAPQVRKANVEAQAEKAAEEGRMQEAQQIKEQWKHEQQRKDSRTLKRIMGKFNKGSMSFVVATDKDGKRTEMRKKEEIEQACLQENNRRFRQASNTPFLTNPLFAEVGPLGMGPVGEAIL